MKLPDQLKDMLTTLREKVQNAKNEASEADDNAGYARGNIDEARDYLNTAYDEADSAQSQASDAMNIAHDALNFMDELEELLIQLIPEDAAVQEGERSLAADMLKYKDKVMKLKMDGRRNIRIANYLGISEVLVEMIVMQHEKAA